MALADIWELPCLDGVSRLERPGNLPGSDQKIFVSMGLGAYPFAINGVSTAKLHASSAPGLGAVARRCLHR
jgi:hypothetical protein